VPYQITQEPDFYRLVFFDDITPHDLRVLVDVLAGLEASLPIALNRLTDLSLVAGDKLTYADVLAFAEERRAQRLANPVKSAIVAPRPVNVGFARMFQILNDNPQIEIQIFPSREAAEAWLTNT
jgi:hypothetical protein